MKFGKRLKRQVHEPWGEYYVDYKKLKHHLKLVCSKEDFIQNDTLWRKLLQRELTKVNSFTFRMESQFSSRLSQMEASLKHTDEETLAQFSQFCRELEVFRYFIVLNYMAISKIIKKRNKRVINCEPMDFRSTLLQQSFYTSDAAAKLTVRTELLALNRLPNTQIHKEEFFCPICLEVLCNPVVLSCTHRFCWNCISSSSNCTQVCPICRKDHELDPSNLTVDWILKRFLMEHFPKSQRKVVIDTQSHNQLVKHLESRVQSFPKTLTKNTQTIVQFTDLHHFNNSGKEDSDGIEMIGNILDRVHPDLVVLTGDIIDGRYCTSYSCFKNIIAPMIERGVPWAYVPGNHDDETELYTRQDLLNVLSLPFCASRNQTSFTHFLEVGPMQIFLIDSNGYLDRNEDHPTYDFIHQDQIEWYKQCVTTGEVGIAFFHIPIVEYNHGRVLIGNKGEKPCTPKHNSGMFQAVQKKKDIHAIFTGHDHWNDYVSELNGVWLGYGRVSGHTSPSIYSDFSNSHRCPVRGARIIQYDSSAKQLSTWIETQQGTDTATLLKRNITSNN